MLAGARVEDGVLVRAPLVESAVGRPRVRGVVIAGRDGRDIRIPAPLVIAADGRRSRIALALRLARHPKWPRRWAVGGYFDGVTDVDDLGEMHVRQHRYIGVAPVPSGLANVCVVTPTREGFDQPAALLERGRRDGLVSGRSLRGRAPGDTACRPRSSRRRCRQRARSGVAPRGRRRRLHRSDHRRWAAFRDLRCRACRGSRAADARAAVGGSPGDAAANAPPSIRREVAIQSIRASAGGDAFSPARRRHCRGGRAGRVQAGDFVRG